MNTIDMLKQFITDELVPENSLENLDKNDSLLESGIIDSLGILKLVTFIEDKFEMRIEAEELIPENFETLFAIVNMISNIRPS